MTVADLQMHALPAGAGAHLAQAGDGGRPSSSAPDERPAAEVGCTRSTPRAAANPGTATRLATVSSAPLARAFRACATSAGAGPRTKGRRVVHGPEMLAGCRGCRASRLSSRSAGQLGFVRRFDRPGGHGPRLPAPHLPHGFSRPSQELCVMASQRHVGRRSMGGSTLLSRTVRCFWLGQTRNRESSLVTVVDQTRISLARAFARRGGAVSGQVSPLVATPAPRKWFGKTAFD